MQGKVKSRITKTQAEQERNTI